MNFSIISHRENSKKSGLSVSGFPNNEVVYFDQEDAAFVHLPPVIYRRYYQSRQLEPHEYGYWSKLISKHKGKYLEANFRECYRILTKILSELNNKLQIINVNNHIYQVVEPTMCPICLTEFEIGSKMESFHHNHVKHLACQVCFNSYNCSSCPICRELVS